MKPLILVVEDDPQIRRFLRATLAAEGYQFHEALTAEEGAAQANQEAVTLEVRDRGAGFAEGEEQRVFEKFYRGKSEGVRGAGLGLAICHAIAAAHRGTIEALNRPGGGAILRVRLPLESAR